MSPVNCPCFHLTSTLLRKSTCLAGTVTLPVGLLHMQCLVGKINENHNSGTRFLGYITIMALKRHSRSTCICWKWFSSGESPGMFHHFGCPVKQIQYEKGCSEPLAPGISSVPGPRVRRPVSCPQLWRGTAAEGASRSWIKGNKLGYDLDLLFTLI